MMLEPTHDNPTFSVITEELEDTFLARIQGDIYDEEALQVQQVILDALANGAKKLLLDLRGVGYICSRTIGVLISLLNRCQQEQVPFAFTNLNDDLHALFATTHLDQVFTLVTNAQDWQQSLR